MAELRSVTIRLDQELFDKIERLAAKNGGTLSDTMRDLLDEGLRERIYGENSETLAAIVRQQMDEVMGSYTAQLNQTIDDVLRTPDRKPRREPARDYRITAFFRTCPDESGILHQ